MKRFIFVLLFLFISASFASAAIYRWVDEKGVVNFTDDYGKVPPEYRNKVEEVNIRKTGPSIPSQAPTGKATVDVQSGKATTQLPPRPLIREGEFAIKLAGVLKIGRAKSDAEAESMLALVGIAPKNGWIADYPVTSRIIGELQNAVGEAVDSGKLVMRKNEAIAVLLNLAAQQGLHV